MSLPKRENEHTNFLEEKAEDKFRNNFECFPPRDNRINYSIISTMKTEKYWCYAIAFNVESTLMLAGCSNGTIRFFTFKEGQLKQILAIRNHIGNVTTLYFMKQSKQFISGGTDKSIQIWAIDNKLNWYCQQQLQEGHTGKVNQVTMNKNEDLIISCSNDNTIKFWAKKKRWEFVQQILHLSWIFSICFNNSGNKLVSCSIDRQINIYTVLNNDLKWRKIQMITAESFGMSINFLGDHMIAFAPCFGIKMDIFALNDQNNLFEKSAEVSLEGETFLDGRFSLDIKNQRSIVLNKNDQNINLIRRQNDGRFAVEQSIKFEIQSITVGLTNDEEYLVTWDSVNEQFQIRKQQ